MLTICTSSAGEFEVMKRLCLNLLYLPPSSSNPVTPFIKGDETLGESGPFVESFGGRPVPLQVGLNG